MPVSLNKVRFSDLTTLRQILLAAARTEESDSWAASCIPSIDDEFGWASGQPILQWEEGPEEWALTFAADPQVAKFLASRHLRIEPVRSWIVAVYTA